MTTRLGAIIAAVIGFALTLAFLWPHRNADNQAQPDRATALVAEPQTKGHLAWADVPFVRVAAQPQPRVSKPIGAVAVPRATRSAEHDLPSPQPDSNTYVPAEPEVPVTFAVETAADESAQNAILRNMSSEPLHVNVTVENPTTGTSSSVQVTVEGHKKTNLTDAGLVYEPGDQVTIESPQYANRIAK